MASINSTTSNYYSALTAGNKGIGGLATGLDTDSLMDSLTLGTRTKIAKQYQQRQLLQWKMTAYRGVGTTLGAIQKKYLTNYTEATSIRSPKFFQAWKGSSSSEAITFNSSKTTSPGSVTVNSVEKLAKEKSITTRAYTKELVGNSEAANLENVGGSYKNKTLSLSVDGASRTIKLDSLDDCNNDATQIAAELQRLLDDAFGTKLDTSTGNQVAIITAGVNADGHLVLSSDTSRITVTSAPSALGFTGGQNNRVSVYDTIGDFFGFGEDESFTFKINGVEFTAASDETVSALMARITNNSAAKARVVFDNVSESFIFTATEAGDGTTLELEDVTGNLLSTWVGIEGGKYYGSTAGNLSMGLDKIIDGSTIATTDKEFADLFTPGQTLSMKLTVNGVTRTISVTVPTITIYDENDVAIDVSLLSDPDEIADYYARYAQELRDDINLTLQAELRLQFNGTGVDISGIAIGIDKDYKTAVNTLGENQLVSIEPGAVPADCLYDLLGFTGTRQTNYDNAATESSSLTDAFSTEDLTLSEKGTFTISVGGVEVTVNYNMSGTPEAGYDDIETVYDLVNLVNNALAARSAQHQDSSHPDHDSTLPIYSAATPAFRVEGGKLVLDGGNHAIGFSDSDGNLMQAVFGTAAYKTAADTGAYKEVPGSNAEVTIDYGNGDIRTLTSTTNDFSINGIGFTVKETTNEAVTISASTSTDELVERITGFIEDYNTLVATLTGMINEKPNKDYDPLTDEQKADMSETEIKNWETEAKKGLLYNDATIRNILSDLRSTFYETVESAGISIYNIGITTKSLISGGSANYADSGQLTIDEDALRAAIERNPEAISALFTDPTDGLGTKLNDAINRAIETSSDKTKRGTLVFLAGTETLTGDNTSTLGDKIEAIDTYVTKLKARLEAEYNRYWRQFSALETAIQRMNAQSSWLADF